MNFKKEIKKKSKEIALLQDKLFASKKHSYLIIIQAMDAAGKDSAIKHIFKNVNTQGVDVSSFKAPSKLEADHDYLWRATKKLPIKGMIGIFNRSHYEEVLVVKIHPQFLAGQNLPSKLNVENDPNFWLKRYESITNWEKHLHEQGTIISKFYLKTSKAEQKKRLLERIENSAKNWKFNKNDTLERAFWDDYQKAYSAMIEHTDKDYAPWHIIETDNQWEGRLMMAEIILSTLNDMELFYPAISKKQKTEMEECKNILNNGG